MALLRGRLTIDRWLLLGAAAFVAGGAAGTYGLLKMLEGEHLRFVAVAAFWVLCFPVLGVGAFLFVHATRTGLNDVSRKRIPWEPLGLIAFLALIALSWIFPVAQ